MTTATKMLTDLQATEIAFALIGIKPNLKLYDANDYEQHIRILEKKPTASSAQLGMEITFQLTQKTPWGQEISVTTYQLYIGYYNTITQFNPGVLALFQQLTIDGEEEMQVEVLGNVGLVTDKLREFGIW